MNDEKTQHIVRIINEKMSKLLHWNNIELAYQSDAWNMKYWWLYDISAYAQHHRNL